MKLLPNVRKKRKRIDGRRLNFVRAKAMTQCTGFTSLVAGLICFCQNHVFIFYPEETWETEKKTTHGHSV